MRRRQFLGVLSGAAVAWPLAVRAQQSERQRRIGVLMSYAADDPEARLRVNALEQRLQALGWSNGHNLRIEYHWAPGADTPALRNFALDVVKKAPELILCNSTPVLSALREQHQAIPIVFLQVTDPVGSRFVDSLARPGGNITGFTDFEYDIGGKWLELLKESDPALKRVAVIMMPGHPGNARILQEMQSKAAVSGVSLITVETQQASEIERTVEALFGEPKTGLILLPSPLAIAQRELIVTLAARGRLPAIFPFRYFATSGGLMSYGIDQVDQWQGAASYVDRILKGEKPATLPVQQPTKFELVINLKTAKAMGLNVAPALLARADEVIE